MNNNILLRNVDVLKDGVSYGFDMLLIDPSDILFVGSNLKSSADSMESHEYVVHMKFGSIIYFTSTEHFYEDLIQGGCEGFESSRGL